MSLPLYYDASSIIPYYDNRPFSVAYRLNVLGLPLLCWYGNLLVDQKLHGQRNQSDDLHRRRGAELRECLVRSGSVALIKSGQALSLRPDLLRNHLWAEELGRLVDEVGSFDDALALSIVACELERAVGGGGVVSPAGERERRRRPAGKRESAAAAAAAARRVLAERFRVTKRGNRHTAPGREAGADPLGVVAESALLSFMFDFANEGRAVASASIGQVYRATLRPEAYATLERLMGEREAQYWAGREVAIKVQRPGAKDAVALDMYLLRRAAMWLSRWRGGDLPAVADQFGTQIYRELDYEQEGKNGEDFRRIYGDWEGVAVPKVCLPLCRRNVLVSEWVDGEKGPWATKKESIEMVRMGLKCSVDQLMHSGLFHADPHRGNLLKTDDGNLAFLDFGMMAQIPEEDRYGLIGLVIGLQNKDLPLITENLLNLGFLQNTDQIDQLILRLRAALKNATGGTGKASDMNFGRLQSELDDISAENELKFSTPPFFTIIIRSLTMLEGLALSVDANFKIVRGAYPYVLAQLLSPEDQRPTPRPLVDLLLRLLTVDGEGQRIEWEKLLQFLKLARQASTPVNENGADADKDESPSSRLIVDIFFKFLTSQTGLFLKIPLVHELAEAIDGMASVTEANLLRLSGGILRPLPGGNGPVNAQRMEDLRSLFDIVREALLERSRSEAGDDGAEMLAQAGAMLEIIQEAAAAVSDGRWRREAGPVLAEIYSVSQMVAAEVLEIRGRRALRSVIKALPVLS